MKRAVLRVVATMFFAVALLHALALGPAGALHALGALGGVLLGRYAWRWAERLRATS